LRKTKFTNRIVVLMTVFFFLATIVQFASISNYGMKREKTIVPEDLLIDQQYYLLSEIKSRKLSHRIACVVLPLKGQHHEKAELSSVSCGCIQFTTNGKTYRRRKVEIGRPELVEHIFGSIDDDLLHAAIGRILQSAGTQGNDIAESGMRALAAAISKDSLRSTDNVGKAIARLNLKGDKLGDILSELGKAVKNIDGNEVLVGFALRAILKNGGDAAAIKKYFQDINKIADAIGPSVVAKKGLRTLLHRTNSGYYPFLFGNIYQVTAAAKIVDELLPGQTIAIEMAVKAGKKTQYTDIVVMSGNTIVKRYEVKRWGSTVEGDPDAAKKLSAQLLRHAAGKTNDVPDFQYIVPIYCMHKGSWKDCRTRPLTH
jgi:hypothetical protein